MKAISKLSPISAAITAGIFSISWEVIATVLNMVVGGVVSLGKVFAGSMTAGAFAGGMAGMIVSVLINLAIGFFGGAIIGFLYAWFYNVVLVKFLGQPLLIGE